MASEEHPSITEDQASVKVRPCCTRRCPVLVEPIMVLYYMSHLPTSKLRSQFIYSKFARELGLDSNKTHGSKSNCDTNTSSPDYDKQLQAQAESADWLIYINIALILPAIVSVLYIGPYSDRGGRRIPILMSTVGLLMNTGITAIMIQFDLSVPWLLLPNFIEGILGYSEGFRMGCFSTLSDITTVQSRSFRLTVLESVYVVTGAVANVGVGYLIHDTGYMIPYATAAGLQGVNIVLILLTIPDSTHKKRHDDEPARLVSCNHFKKVAELLKGDITPGGKTKLYLLLFGFLIYRVLFGGKVSVETLYQLNAPLCWNAIEIGYFGLMADTVFGLTALILVPLMQRCCDLSDGQMIALGMTTAIAQGTFEAFARTKTMMLTVPFIGFGMLLAIALYRAIFSKLVGPDKIGVIFAGIAVLELISSFISATAFNALYSVTLHILHGGFVFLVVAGMSCISFTLIMIYSLKYEHWRCFHKDVKYQPLNSSG